MFAAHMTIMVCAVGVWGEQKTKGMYRERPCVMCTLMSPKAVCANGDTERLLFLLHICQGCEPSHALPCDLSSVSVAMLMQ